MPTTKKTTGQEKTGRKRTTTTRNTNGTGKGSSVKRTSTGTGRKKPSMRNNGETEEE